MKTKSLKTMLMVIAIAIATAFASCSKHTEVNALIDTLNNYAQSFKEVQTPEEFTELMDQFNTESVKYKDSTEEVSDADREAILKAIYNFSSSVSESLGKLMGNQQAASAEQREAELNLLRQHISDCKTLGEVTNVCSQQ